MNFKLAPSYANYTILTEPYAKNGKMYVTIQHPNTGNQRAAICYDEAGKPLKPNADGGFSGLKEARGFADGPIFVVVGADFEDAECRASAARYAEGMGWYFLTRAARIPGRDYVRLEWEECSIDERHMRPAEELAQLIKEKANKDTVPWDRQKSLAVQLH